MKFTKTVAVASVALGMALVSAVASAAVTFTMDTGGSNSPANAYGNDRGFNGDDGAGGIQLVADAWANTGSGSGTSALIRNAYLGQYSGGGLGVCDRSESSSWSPSNCGSPAHSTDSNGKLDSVLFSFNGAVNLAEVEFGWAPGDSDFSVLYYTGGGSVTTLDGLNYASMVALGGGWSVLGNYNHSGTGSTNVGDGTKFSKYWLVSGFSSAFGSGSGLDVGDDYFKIKEIVVNVPVPTQQSPEPATLGLLGLGLTGLGFLRRRRK